MAEIKRRGPRTETDKGPRGPVAGIKALDLDHQQFSHVRFIALHLLDQHRFKTGLSHDLDNIAVHPLHHHVQFPCLVGGLTGKIAVQGEHGNFCPDLRLDFSLLCAVFTTAAGQADQQNEGKYQGEVFHCCSFSIRAASAFKIVHHGYTKETALYPNAR